VSPSVRCLIVFHNLTIILLQKRDANSCRSSYSLYRRSMAVKMADAIDTDLSAHGVRDMTKGLVTRKIGTNPARVRTLCLRQGADGI
jgi:hypothetical protein